MGEFQVSGPEIKKMVKVARRQPISFAFNPGKNEEETYFGLHRKKAPKILGKEAKQEGEGTKFACGTATVNGKVLSLTCERELPSLAKKLKRYLKSQKVMLNVEVLDASGNLLEADIEDDLPDDPDMVDDDVASDSDPQATAAEDRNEEEGAPGAHDAAEIAQRLAGQKARIAALPDAAAAQLQLEFANAVALVRSGDLALASAEADRIDEAINTAAGQAASAPPAPDGELVKLEHLLRGYREQAGALDDKVRGAKILLVLDKAAELIQGGDAKGAVQYLVRVRDALNPAVPDNVSADSAATGAGDPMVIWRDAKEGTDADISALQKALSGADHPDLKRIVEFGIFGATEGNQVAMARALMEFNTAQTPDKPKFGQALLKQTATYRAFLNESPVIALCEDNPFGVRCSIKAPILTALDQIENVVRASG